MLVLPFALLLLQTVPDAPAPQGRLVQVKPGPKRYFYLGDEARRGCPARLPACRRKAYVVPGDQLVATEARGPFTRVVHVAPGRTDPTQGWIESDALLPIAPPAAKPGSWLGKWAAWDNKIEIKRGARPGTLRISGTALWGGRDPERVARGGVHVGEIDGDAPLRGETVVHDYRDTGCEVRLKLLGPYLLAEDNGLCGGANVSFGGVYRR